MRLFFPPEVKALTVIYGVCGADGRALARQLLRYAVQDSWGWQSLPELRRSPRGKPLFPAQCGAWFSLSHSGGAALCALCDEGSVGVDIERIRPRRPGLPAYIGMTPQECGGNAGWAEFYRLWTLKESFCKWEDIPLYPPSRLPAVPPCPHESYRGEDWAAAVCTSGALPGAIRWIERRQLET